MCFNVHNRILNIQVRIFNIQNSISNKCPENIQPMYRRNYIFACLYLFCLHWRKIFEIFISRLLKVRFLCQTQDYFECLGYVTFRYSVYSEIMTQKVTKLSVYVSSLCHYPKYGTFFNCGTRYAVFSYNCFII